MDRLNHIEVGYIAESMLKGHVSQKLTYQLTLESSGNPLFIVESLKFLSEQKGLVKENDCWVTVNENFGIPEKVKDVILRRLNSLSLDVRDILDAGSVIGDKFDAELIGSVLGERTVKVLSTLNAISKSESIVICENDWFRFDHPKTREVLYQEISAPLRKEYHLRTAEILEKCAVKAIWNFSAAEISLKSETIIEDVHLSDSLMTLSYRVNERKMYENI
jgi:predicted ATPase